MKTPSDPDRTGERRDPYDYGARAGVRPVSWEDFHDLVRDLARVVEPWRPEMLLALGRGGLYPGALLAHLLRVEVHAVRISRREADVVRHRSPVWTSEPPEAVRGARVLVVDEICDTGETLTLVKERLAAMGVAETKCAVLYAHVASAAVPDYVGLETDALVLNPWDREILERGVFRPHPEYVEALARQGLSIDPRRLGRET